MLTVNINGDITNAADARISVLDRGFLYGDSVYEVTMSTGRKPVFLKEHLDRLESSASMIGMDIGNHRRQIEERIDRSLEAHGPQRCYIRIIVTRGEGDEITLDPGVSTKRNVIIIVKDLPEYPRSWYEQGVGIIVSKVVRNSKEAMDPNIKSGNYLNNILAMAEAKKRGAFDAVMLNSRGFVAEATTSNVWVVEGSTLITPPLEAGILNGITRRVIFEISRAEVCERNFTADEMKGADECFLSSTTREIVPVASIDGRPIGDGLPGPRTRSLLRSYRHYAASRLR